MATDAGLKERFYRYFQHEAAALQDQIDRLNTMSLTGGERNDAIEHCLAGIDRLSHEVKDASTYIPAYDQRSYSQGVKGLSEKLQETRNAFNPPKKFAFKTRKNASAVSMSDAAELAQLQKLRAPVYTSDSSNANSSFAPIPVYRLSPGGQKTQQEAMSRIEEDGLGDVQHENEIQRPKFANATQITISNREQIYVKVPSAASHATGSGTISNVKRCVIDLTAPTSKTPFSALYVKDVRDSLILCGQVAGAVHITNLSNSVLVTSCRQFRMHGSKSVNIYLHSNSHPIIEDCEDVKFAPSPEVLVSAATAKTANQWDQIDDFKWLKAGPSPNFGVLEESSRVKEEVWTVNVLSEQAMGLAEVLTSVGVQA